MVTTATIGASTIKNAIYDRIKNSNYSITIAKEGNPNTVITTVSISTLPIQREAIKQEAKRPFLGIQQNNLTQIKINNQRFERLYQMKISFYSLIGDTKLYTHLDEVGNALMEILMDIDVVSDIPDGLGGYKTYPVRGIQMDYKIQEDVMIFFVSYPIRVYKQTAEETPMGEVTIDTNIK